jgi:endonuclease/exonuclease/phosphatase family metal-dependent hydrolase
MNLLRFAWWNTNLAPGGKARDNTASRWKVATEVVRQLLDRIDADLLALGEVSERDVEQLRGDVKRQPLELLCETTETWPKGLAVLYDRRNLELVEREILSTARMGTDHRRGLRLTFHMAEPASAWLHVFVLHLPSSYQNNAGPDVRARIAQDLREEVTKWRDSGHVVVFR